MSEQVFKEQMESFGKEMRGIKSQTERMMKEMFIEMAEMRTQINDQKKSIEFMSEGYDRLKAENESMAEKLKELEKKNGVVEKKLVTGEEKLARVGRLEDVTKEMEDQKDKERRKKNLIFYNLPESKNDDVRERIKDDWVNVKKVFERKGLELKKNDLGNMYRLGRDKIQGRSRPLLIRFEREEQKREVLHYCKDLKLVREKESTPIFYSMDLTIKEREERRKLVAELKKRKENGQTNVAIRNGKIVNIIGSRPQRVSWASLFKV